MQISPFCRSPRGERGLKLQPAESAGTETVRRSPRGERGLKSKGDEGIRRQGASLPPRGAWIEIRGHLLLVQIIPRRSPRGERGLK